MSLTVFEICKKDRDENWSNDKIELTLRRLRETMTKDLTEKFNKEFDKFGNMLEEISN